VKPEPEVVIGAILQKNRILGAFFLKGTKLKYLPMVQFSTKMANFWRDGSRHVCL